MTLFEPYARKHYALYALNLVFEGFEKSTLCYISHEKNQSRAFGCQGVIPQTNHFEAFGEPVQVLSFQKP